MNRNDLKDRIKESALNDMPEVFQKIDLEKIDIQAKERPVIKSHLRYKLLISAFIFVLLAVFTFQVFINYPSSQGFESDTDLLAFQVVSAQSFIEYDISDSEDINGQLSNNDTILNVSKASDVEDYIEEMSRMIELGELMINKSEEIQYLDKESDDSNYQYQVRFSAINLLGNDVNYDIYFNQVSDRFEGKLIYGDLSYTFIQNNEGLRLYKNQEDFVQVTYSDNQNIHQFSLKYMQEEVNVYSGNIELVLENKTYHANFEYNNQQGMVINMQMSRNNESSIDIDYQVKDNAKRFNGQFSVTSKENQGSGQAYYQFKFGDDSEIESDKPGRQHQNGQLGHEHY